MLIKRVRVCVCILIAGRYEWAVAAVMTRLDGHLPGRDVTADVTEFTFKQLLHDSAQPRDGLFLFVIYSFYFAFSGLYFLHVS